jgi:hypothetical protein
MLAQLQEAKQEIVRYVGRAYQRTTKSINGLHQGIHRALDSAHIGLITLFSAVAAGVVNGARKINRALDYPESQLDRMRIPVLELA